MPLKPSVCKRVLTTIFLVVALNAAHAVTWDNESADGAWSTALNWDTDAEPTGADAVILPLGIGTTITLSTGELADTLLFQDNGYTLSAGNLTLTSGTITVDPTFSATISSQLAGTTITKSGTGSLVLSGANTYTGLTTVSAGVLNVQNATGLGTTAGATSVTSGAALELEGGIVITGEALTLNGNGIASSGALRNISGNNSFNGNITLGSATLVSSDAGTLTINPAAGNAFAGAFALTFGGAGNITVNDPIATGAGTVTKDGTGRLTLTGASTYTGLTTINNGALRAQSATALGTNAAGTTVANGAALEIQGTITIAGEALTLNGTGIANTGALRNITNNNSYNGNITLASDSRINSDANTLTINPAAGNAISGNFNLTLGGAGAITVSRPIAIGTGNLTKDGTGTATFLLGNTYTGTTTVSAGALNIRNATGLGTSASGTSVTAGASLQLQGGITITNEALTLNGLGVGSAGALRNISGNNNYNGNITLGSASRINSDAGILTINPAIGDSITATNQNLTLGGAGNIVVSKAITTGTGTLTKDGTGTSTLLGANTYSGTTTISAGALNIQNNAALGTTAGATSVTTGAALQMQGGITVTGEALTLNGTGVGNSGALRNISGSNNYNGNITLGAATRINSDSGTLTINPAAGNSIAATNQNLTLGGAGNIVVSRPIATGTGTLTKDGAGTVTLNGANTFTGATTVAGGTLQLNYGANSSMLSDTAALTFTGGTLDLAGSVAHNEIVVSTTVNGTSFITRSTGTSTIRLNTITFTSGSLDISADNIASTDNLNDGSGIIGSWLTVGGVWATNSTNGADGNIIAYTGFTDIPRLGGTVVSAGGSNVRITDVGNTAGNITMAAGGTTTISTLLQAAPGGTATVNIGGGNTLRIGTGGVSLTSGNGALTFNNTGTLTAGPADNTAATFTFYNYSASNAITVNSVIANNGTGAVSLVKGLGTGLLTLTGANTYTGATTVNAGVLNVQNNTALGTNAAGTTVINNAALELQGGITITGEALNLSGTGISSGGALRNISSNNNYNGNITLAAATRINSDAGTLTIDPSAGNAITAANLNLTFGGAGNIAVSDPIAIGTGTLTKDGVGTLTLSGANTYTGATTISAGVVNAQNITALGTTAGGVTVSGGAALELQGGIAFGAEALTLNGTGVSSGGALRSVSGTNSWSGTVALNSASGVGVDAGALTLSGVISGANSLAKSGTGTLILSGANTYTGAVNVNAGVLNLRNNTALGTTAGNTTVANGAALELQNTITVTGELLTLGGTGISGGGALRNVVNNNSFNSNLTLSADTRINSDSGTLTINPTAGSAITGGFNLTFGGAGNITLNDPITTGAGTLTKDGAGRLILTGASSYTGLTTISAGALRAQNATALGTSAAGTVVSTGAALELAGTVTITGEALTLNGTGIASGGALRNTVNNNSFNSTITLASNSRINSDSGTLAINPAGLDAITGNFNLALGGAGAITVSRPITIGSGTLTKDGAGTVVLTGVNTYTGLTTVSAGVLAARSANALGTNAAGTTVANGAALQIQGTITITGEALTLNGTGIGNTGALRNVTNTNSFNGNITLASDTRINSDANTLTINPASGDSITGVNRNLTLGGAGALVISSGITTGSGTLTKDGTGTVTLLGANSYTGLTTISAGSLNVRNATGLGTNASGTTVTSGANLQLQGGITITGEALTLNGTGIANAGALRNISEDNNFNGNITLGSNTRIDSNANTLTINPASGNAISGNFNLTLGGNGNTTILQPIATGAGTITKDGTGILTLGGANTYTGLTTINAGVIAVQNNTGLGTSAAGTTVTNGAALQILNNITVTNESLTLNGTGITNSGALRNISGTNSYNGNITLATASRINSDAGTLTINPSAGNAITSANQNLTLGGAGALVISRPIALGSGTLTKDGTGTATLSGANTYTGLTTVSAGILDIQNNGALGTTAAGTSVTGGATLQLRNNITITGEALTLNGTGVGGNGTLLNLADTNQYNGNITLASASRINSDAGTLTINPASGDSITAANQNLTLGGAGNIVISKAITTGTGTLTKDGAGVVTLEGSNSYTGTTTISAGTLALSRSAADNTTILGDGNTATSGDIVINGGTLSFTQSEQIADTAHIVMTSGNLEFNGSGLTETIDGFENSGGTFITGANTLDGLGATITWAGGVNTISDGGNVGDRHWIITGGTNTVQSGPLGGGLMRVQTGAAPPVGLIFGGTASPTITLQSASGTDGAGEMRLRQNVFVDATLTSGTASILNGGGGTTSGFIDMFGGTRTFSINNGSASTDMLISARIQNGALIKTGAGTLELTGNNTFAGATTISGGVLIANGANTLGSTASVLVNSAGTLLLDGTGNRVNDSAAVTLAGGLLSMGDLVSQSETFGSLTLTANSAIDFGTGSGNTLFFSSLNLSGFTLAIYGWTGIPYGGNETVDHGDATQDRLLFDTTTIPANTLSQIVFFNDSGTYIGNGHQVDFGGDFEIVPVPEPATVFGSISLVLLIGYRERRRVLFLLQKLRASRTT